MAGLYGGVGRLLTAPNLDEAARYGVPRQLGSRAAPAARQEVRRPAMGASRLQNRVPTRPQSQEGVAKGLAVGHSAHGDIRMHWNGETS
jgi:hypothetical protein